jgi:hypothetical protein
MVFIWFGQFSWDMTVYLCVAKQQSAIEVALVVTCCVLEAWCPVWNVGPRVAELCGFSRGD